MKNISLLIGALTCIIAVNSQADFKSFVKGVREKANEAFKSGTKLAQSEEFKNITRTLHGVVTSDQAKQLAAYAGNKAKQSEYLKRLAAEAERKGLTQKAKMLYAEAKEAGITDIGKQVGTASQQYLSQKGYLDEKSVAKSAPTTVMPAPKPSVSPAA